MTRRIELAGAIAPLLFCAAVFAAGQAAPDAPAASGDIATGAIGADPEAAEASSGGAVDAAAADAVRADGSAGAGSAAASSGERRTIGPSVDECFNSQGMIDIGVLDDSHLYLRTRGSNFYLVTTDHCDNLEKSFLHRTAYLVPHGRTVCRDDGSHVLYNDAGRQAVCAIRAIERVEDRAEARDLAAGSRSVAGFEELPVE